MAYEESLDEPQVAVFALRRPCNFCTNSHQSSFTFGLNSFSHSISIPKWIFLAHFHFCLVSPTSLKQDSKASPHPFAPKAMTLLARLRRSVVPPLVQSMRVVSIPANLSIFLDIVACCP
jgi:hypothetical protein